MPRICPECNARFDTNVLRCPHDDSPTLVIEREDDLIGRTLEDRFTIRSLLGVGGMGAVYRAHQHSMDRDVALKLLKRDLANDEQAIKRFFREAKAASRLTGPHVITVFDFGQTSDGLLFIVMELLKGRSLARELRDHPGAMAPARAVRIVLQVLDALAEAHESGVLHRDLKPDNIFLLSGRDDDFVKVLDFGIAKMLGGDSTSLTNTGMIFGTPTYMSPEQGQGYDVDHRSDLYAVGVILFELLAGKPPFRADTPLALVYKKVHEKAPLVYHVNPDVQVPAGLDEVLSQLLAVRPDDRPVSAREAARLLSSLSLDPTTPGVPMPDVVIRHGTTEIVPATRVLGTMVDVGTPEPTPFRGMRQPGRKRRWAWWAAGAIVLASLVAAAVLGLGGRTAGPETSPVPAVMPSPASASPGATPVDAEAPVQAPAEAASPVAPPIEAAAPGQASPAAQESPREAPPAAAPTKREPPPRPKKAQKANVGPAPASPPADDGDAEMLQMMKRGTGGNAR